jgi:hypothetical protein
VGAEHTFLSVGEEKKLCRELVFSRHDASYFSPPIDLIPAKGIYMFASKMRPRI